MTLMAYTDADLGNSHSRKSTTGGVVVLNGAIIHAFSKTQGTIALSSAESEFNALVIVTQTVLHVKEILSEIGYEHHPLVVTDSSVAIQLVYQNTNGRAKNIDRKMAWLKQEVKEKKSITLRHIDGKSNIADLMTKYVTSNVLSYLRAKLFNTERIPFEQLKIRKINKKDDNN